MTSTFKRIIIAAIGFIAAAALAVALVLSGGCSTQTQSPVDGARNSAVNAVLDLSGVKDRIDAKVRTKASELAQSIGVPQSVADNVVDSLAIGEWKATTLPADTVETGTYSIDADDMSALVTTYDDPSIVTVQAYGQTVTMEVPDSAKSYMHFIKYLDYLQ